MTFPPPFLAAAVQATPVFLDLDATVDKVIDIIGKAADRNARLVAFPESFIPGFPYWPRGYLRDRDRSITALAQLYENALELGSPLEAKIAEAARDAEIYVVIGATERDESAGTTLFNSLLYYSPQGKRIGHHRKLVPTGDESCVWGVGDGSHLAVHHTDIGRIGGLICGNNDMTLAKAALLFAGEQIHIASWPGFTRHFSRVDLACRAYAKEGGVYVVVSSSYMTADDVPADFVLRNETDWSIDGYSGIIGPDGEWVVGPVTGREEIVIGEVDLAKIVTAKAQIDGIGKYSRPDIFRFEVQIAPQRRRGEAATPEDWRQYS